jgi:outer membrane protein assembly factor BamB
MLHIQLGAGLCRNVMALLFFLSAGLLAAEIADPLTDAKLREGWQEQKSAKTLGGITATADGVALRAETLRHVSIKRDNAIVGSDDSPLSVSVFMRPAADSDLPPGLTLFWDSQNFIQLTGKADNNLTIYVRQQGVTASRTFPDAAPGVKQNGVYLRLALISRNVLLYAGNDGVNWRQLGHLGLRPGKEGVAPGRIIIGRGAAEDPSAKESKPDLANDFNPDARKPLIETTFRDFRCSDRPEPMPEDKIEFDPKIKTWADLLENMEAATIPKNWSLLGSLADKDFKLWKQPLAPDKTDDWKTPPKDDQGKPFRVGSWTQPEEAGDAFVDLREIMDPNSMALAYARAEIDWPVDGAACLWFDNNGHATVAINNEQVFNDKDYPARRAAKDRYCHVVRMKKGKNFVKVKAGQMRGEWGFYLRVERNDPGYRISLLTRLLEAFPEDAKGWRGAAAMLEIARQHEKMLNFPQALAAWQKAIDAFASSDEHRSEALECKLHLLEMQRNWSGLAAAGEAHLARFGQGAGFESAFRACVIGDTMSGKLEAAEARVGKWVDDAGNDSERIAWALRLLAGAAENAGRLPRALAALERLGAHKLVDSRERARAWFELAATIHHLEYLRAQNGEKPDPQSLIPACAAWKAGVALLPSAAHPQAQAFLKDADDDLKAGRHERAAAGGWSAALLALCAADPEAASLLAVGKAVKLPVFNLDAAGKPRDLTDPLKAESHAVIAAASGQIKFKGAWKAIGPFDNTDGIGERAAYGPETNPDTKAGFPAKGGQKSWLDLDPKAWHEMGQDLNALGNCANGVAYVSGEFEIPAARAATLFLSVRAGWAAWLDGKPVGENFNETFKLDGARVPLQLGAGRHRLLLKLAAPGEGPFTFRARIGDEAELATNILRAAWLQREYPEARRFYDVHGELRQQLNFSQHKIGGPAFKALGDAIAMVYAGHGDVRFDVSKWTFETLLSQGYADEAILGWRQLLARVDTWPDHVQRPARTWEITARLHAAYLSQGEARAADELMRIFMARHPDLSYAAGEALINRATLRQDFALSQSSRPFFERAVREISPASASFRYAEPGLNFARSYLPERVYLETNLEVENSVDAATRLLKTGNAQDVERAMGSFNAIMRAHADSLINVDGSRFFPRYSGLREYFRALLQMLPAEMREAYQKTVASASQARCQMAVETGDAADMELMAGEYDCTPAALRALNNAGNLHMDRGLFAQAAAAFKYILQEYRGLEGYNEPLLLAKLARALLMDSQYSAATAFAQRLQQDHGSASFTIKGAPVSGARHAQALLEQIRQAAKKSGDSASATQTYAGNPQRAGAPLTSLPPKPGPLLWARPLGQSAMMDAARARLTPDPFAHVQSFPVIDNGRVIISTLEALQAYDLGTGNTLWRQAWGGLGSLLPRQFTGFPVSCPTVGEGRVYLRVMSDSQSGLSCHDAKDGLQIWNTLSIPELKNAVWLSDPVVVYGLAIAPFLLPGDRNVHGIAAVDAVTGRFRWRQMLQNGPTGIRVGQGYMGASMQLGPPAADRGVVYAQTGIGSLAALNAFTGDIVWLSCYPRLTVNDWNRGNSGATQSMFLRLLKLMSRGPMSPVVGEDVVALAPKDAVGVYGFDRKTGAPRWKLDMDDSRFLAGVCENTVLLADNTVRAVNINTGAQVWQYNMQGEPLFGHPGYAGGVLYLPTENGLQLVDARNGKLQSITPWDPRAGPLANFAITGKEIVGLNSSVAAALGPPGGPLVELPLQEAQAALAAGATEKAGQLFARALKSASGDDVLPALSGWVKTQGLAGKKEETLGEVDRVLAGQPAVLSSPQAFWQISKAVYADALRARLGQPVAPPPAAPQGISGALAFSWHLEGSNAKLFLPADGPQDRFFALAGYNLYALRMSPVEETLWKVYIGPDATDIKIGPSAIAVQGQQKLTLIDRHTGEQMWSTLLPTDARKKQLRANADTFYCVGLDDTTVAAASGGGLFVYDLRSGRELWWNERLRRRPVLLTFSKNKLIEVSKIFDHECAYASYEQRTGRRTGAVALPKSSLSTAPLLTDSGLLLIQRLNANTLAGLDLETGQHKWTTPAPNLEVNQWTPQQSLRLLDGLLIYSGDAKGGPDKGWLSLVLNPADGKIIHKRPGLSHSFGNDMVLFGERNMVSRVESDGKGGQKAPAWTTTLPGAPIKFLEAFLSFNKLYVWQVQNAGLNPQNDQFVLRVLDWETGHLLSSECLPGTPARTGSGYPWPNTLAQRRNLLLYAAQEGIFAYSPLGQTRLESAAMLRGKLAQPELPVGERRNLRRALAEIDAPTQRAFLAPPEAKIDGDLSEWSAMDPLPVQSAQDFVPLAPDRKWGGPQDLSARVYTAWNAKGIFVAIDAQDDVSVPPRPGSPLNSGDSARIAFNSMTDPRNGLLNPETVVCSLGVVEGRTVLNVQPEPDPGEPDPVQGCVVRSPNGKGCRYELLVPWAVLKRDPNNRPGGRKELRMGVAVFDNDGQGVNGLLEWGAGVSDSQVCPARLGQLALLDISREKIERYRKVIALLPDAYESFKLLNLILLSKRGENAVKERVDELEGYVKQFPDRQNAGRALGLLRAEYANSGETKANARVIEFAKAAKCPPAVIDNAANKVLRVWALPDEKNPPGTIMLQFHQKGVGWCRRAYWGANNIDFGASGTAERKWMGPLPAPGRWTQLELYPIDFDLDDAEITHVAFTSFGGLLHWDRLSIVVDGKETLLMDDALPPKFKADVNPLQFTATPHHDGATAWTGGPASGLMNSHVGNPDLSVWFSFRSANPVKPPEIDASALQKRCREAAGILTDMPEEFTFLNRVIELIVDKKEYVPQCIKEFEEHLQKYPGTQNALQILQALRSYYTQNGDKNPVARCEELITKCRLPRDSRRAFYSQVAPVWMDWHVIGPIQAAGERRGQDVILPPERAVDLAWQIKGPDDIDLVWTRIGPPKDKQGVANCAGPVNLHAGLVEKLPNKKQQAEITRGAYFAYAYVKFTAPTARRALLLYGVNDIASVWVNGRKVVVEASPGAGKDSECKEISLRGGENEVLIKAGVREGKLLFNLRIASETGRPFDDLTISEK